MDRSHLVIPDTQVKRGIDIAHIVWAAEFIKDHTPEVIVVLGDWWDLPSLSSYDRGTKSFEGRRYTADIEAGEEALQILLDGIRAVNKKRIKQKKKLYNPELHFIEGNHEYRTTKAMEASAELEGVLVLPCDIASRYGFHITSFLDSVEIDGVHYSHYFYRKNSGRNYASARATLTNEHCSTVQGHSPGLQIDITYNAAGKQVWAIIAGSFYSHEETFKGKKGNEHWRGMLHLVDVNDGQFDLEIHSIHRLRRKYGDKCRSHQI